MTQNMPMTLHQFARACALSFLLLAAAMPQAHAEESALADHADGHFAPPVLPALRRHVTPVTFTVPNADAAAEKALAEPAPDNTAPKTDQAACKDKASSWTRTCADAGYPADYAGEIHGETRVLCRSGKMRDVWLSNSCVPKNNAVAPKTTAKAATPSAADRPAAPLTVVVEDNRKSAADEPPRVLFAKEEPAAAPHDLPAIAPAAAKTHDDDAPLPSAATAKPHAQPDKQAAKPAAEQPAAPQRVAAPPAELDSMCGPAAKIPAAAAPVQDLCASGKPGPVKGAGPWSWACTDAKRMTRCTASVAIPAAVCGSAHNRAVAEAPSQDLCKTGKPGDVSGTGPWQWVCDNGAGAVRAQCVALKIEEKPVETAEAAAPAVAASEPPAAVMPPEAPKPQAEAEPEESEASIKPKVNDDPVVYTKPDVMMGPAVQPKTESQPEPKIVWQAPVQKKSADESKEKKEDPKNKDAKLAENPAPAALVPAQSGKPQKLPRIDGVCGAATRAPAETMPSGELCKTGLPGPVNGKGPWSWLCNGVNKGTSVACAAPFAHVVTPPAAAKAKPETAPDAPVALTAPQPTVAEAPQLPPLSLPPLPPSPQPDAVKPAEEKPPVETPPAAPEDSAAAEEVAPVSPPLTMPPFHDETAPLPAPLTKETPPPSPAVKPPVTAHRGAQAKTAASAPVLMPPQFSSTGTILTVPPAAAMQMPTATNPAKSAAAANDLGPGKDRYKPVPPVRAAADGAKSAPSSATRYETLTFDAGVRALSPDANAMVVALGRDLSADAASHIMVTAYAGPTTDARGARRLSLSRAKAVYDALIAAGARQGQITTRALGANASSGNPDRVDIKLQ